MADINVHLEYLSRTESLPAACIRCGRAASGVRGFRLRASEPRRSSSLAGILVLLGRWSWRDRWQFENVLHESRVARGKLKLPVCWRHRWLLPPRVGVRLVNETTVALSNVTDQFAAEMRKRGWTR